MREVLGAAWRLFQVCLPTCLPLAIVGVAASATPSAETAASGEAYGYLHSNEWWGVCVASLLLMLICYGGMLRQQLALAAGEPARVMDSLRRAVRDLPGVFALWVLCLLSLAPAVISTVLRGFDAVALLLTIAALAVLLYAWPAWPALIAGTANPWAALCAAVRMVRGRWLHVAGAMGALLFAAFVFLLLAGILMGMVMHLAGQGESPTASALAASRWLIAVVLGLPVLYAGAVTVVLYRRVAR